MYRSRIISTQTTDSCRFLHWIGLCQWSIQDFALIMNHIITKLMNCTPHVSQVKRSRYMYNIQCTFFISFPNITEIMKASTTGTSRMESTLYKTKYSIVLSSISGSSPNLYKEKISKSQNIKTLRTRRMRSSARNI